MQAEPQTTTEAARALVVGRDERAAATLVETLRAGWPTRLVVVHAVDVADAVPELVEYGAGCVLLQIPGDAAAALSPLHEIAAAAPDAPIVVVCGEADEAAGLDAVRAGAQDVLLGSELNAAGFARAVSYAIERKRAEVALGRQALQDPLTELPNRVLFGDRLTVALDRARRTDRWPALMFLDVDSFKEVNDTLGHAAGDRLLQVLADRFRALLRPMDTVARIGGDEFTFLFEGLGGEAEAIVIADRIAEAAAAPVALGGPQETTVTVSVGITMVDDPDTELGDALRDADAAMYRAKDGGGDRAELFDLGARSRVAGRVSPEEALRTAIQSRELRVHYQPQVSISGRTGLVGFEALVRWEHPERGLIPPAEFVPLAEETGLIAPLGDWVTEQALRQVDRWRRSRPGMTISVNLSRRQLEDPSYAERLRAAIARSGSDPGVLWLEIAQGAVDGSPSQIASALGALREVGVKLALDDVGGDGAALPDLSGLPVDMLKIHRRFVSGLGGAGGDEAIAGAVVARGHALGLDVVAEGVETDAQLARLRDLGCDGAQGFLFSQPVPEGAVGELLGAR